MLKKRIREHNRCECHHVSDHIYLLSTLSIDRLHPYTHCASLAALGSVARAHCLFGVLRLFVYNVLTGFGGQDNLRAKVKFTSRSSNSKAREPEAPGLGSYRQS